MKNHEYIRKMKVKDLARLLVRAKEVNEGYEGMDGEWGDYYVTRFFAPDGSYLYYYDDAVAYTIDWLNADMRGGIDGND